jgi:hypothetical protein
MAIGRLICGYYNREIDKTIDEHSNITPSGSITYNPIKKNTIYFGLFSFIVSSDIDDKKMHDKARVSCDTLFSQARNVLNKYGEKGLCYYVLHHYLDKIENIIFGQILSQWSKKYKNEDDECIAITEDNTGSQRSSIEDEDNEEYIEHSLEGIEKRIKEIDECIKQRKLSGYEDGFDKAVKDVMNSLRDFIRIGLESEISTFKVIETIVLENIKNPWDLIRYGFDITSSYTSRTGSKKRDILMYLWADCLQQIEGQSEVDIAKTIASMSRYVREKIAENAEKIWCTILRYDYKRLAVGKKFGPDITLLMMKTLQCDKIWVQH